MIIYLTKQTIARYKMEMPEEMAPPYRTMAEMLIENEQSDRLLEWGGKLFYFDRRKCVQVVNFASKFTLFLVDVKVGQAAEMANSIAQYMLDMYAEDKKMVAALQTLFKAFPISCFARLTDRSIISTLNFTQRTFLENGYRLYDFISDDGILHTKAINRKVNFDWIFSGTINGKKEYFNSGDRLRDLVMERFGRKNGS